MTSTPPDRTPPKGPLPETAAGGAAPAGRAPARGRPSILRLRAGLLLLVASVLLCGAGGHFVARQFGLGLGWALLIAIAIWVGMGVVLSRLDGRVYFGAALAATALLAYLVYDFTASALDWPLSVALVLAIAAMAFLAFTFHDFRRLKTELRIWAYKK